MNAIILLAGTGSRLKPLTNNKHKALLTLQGKTILERQIRQLKSNGIMDFCFVLGHRAGEIQRYVEGNFSGINSRFILNENFLRNNTAASLHLALRQIEDDFILLDGDVVMSDILVETLCSRANEFAASLRESPCILLAETDPAKLDSEAVKFSLKDGTNEIADVGKHIPVDEASGESIGVGYYSKAWAHTLKNHLDLELENENNWNWYYEDAIHRLLRHGETPSSLQMLTTGEYPWVEIDDLNDFNRAQEIQWD